MKKLSVTKILLKLIKTDENNNYIVIGNVAVCWGNDDFDNQYRPRTLPITYLSNPIGVATIDSSQSKNIAIALKIINTNSFSIQSETSDTIGCNWLTIGFVDRNIVGGY